MQRCKTQCRFLTLWNKVTGKKVTKRQTFLEQLKSSEFLLLLLWWFAYIRYVYGLSGCATFCWISSENEACRFSISLSCLQCLSRRFSFLSSFFGSSVWRNFRFFSSMCCLWICSAHSVKLSTSQTRLFSYPALIILAAKRFAPQYSLAFSFFFCSFAKMFKLTLEAQFING